MKTFEQLQHEWGNSKCGRSIEQYVYDYFTEEYIPDFETHLAAVESRAVILEARCARYELLNKPVGDMGNSE